VDGEAYQATYAQMPAHVRLGMINVFNVDSYRVGAFATALMSRENAARVQPGYTRYH
jgi:hypothetical protein